MYTKSNKYIVILTCIAITIGISLKRFFDLFPNQTMTNMSQQEIQQLLYYFPKECNFLHKVTETSKLDLLLYNMVPKCGSSSVRKMLSDLALTLNYTSHGLPYYKHTWEHNVFHHNHTFISHNFNQHLKKLRHKHHSGVYYRHVHFVDFSAVTIGTHPLYMNVVRDPVDHYISWYVYRRYGAFGQALGPLEKQHSTYYKSDAWRKLKNMTFDECVMTKHEECNDYIYTYRMIPYFCGNYDFCLKPSIQSLLKAMDNVLNFYPLVGYVENMTMFYEVAEIIWPQYFNGSVSLYRSKREKEVNFEHKTKGRDKIEPSNVVKDIMKERLKFEYIFYNWIKRRIHCMYEYYVSSNKR